MLKQLLDSIQEEKAKGTLEPDYTVETALISLAALVDGVVTTKNYSEFTLRSAAILKSMYKLVFVVNEENNGQTPEPDTADPS